MRIRHPVVAFLVFSIAMLSNTVQASSTLRVGNQVLTAGDSRERVTALLGKPASKTHGKHRAKSRVSRHGGVRVSDNRESGEQWRYRRDGHVTVVTIVDGRVSDIQDDRI